MNYNRAPIIRHTMFITFIVMQVVPWEARLLFPSHDGNIFRVTGHLYGKFTGPSEFPAQRPVTRSFDVFFDLCLNKRLSKQSWGRWSETLSRPLWRHCNDLLWRLPHDDGPMYHFFACQRHVVSRRLPVTCTFGAWVTKTYPCWIHISWNTGALPSENNPYGFLIKIS